MKIHLLLWISLTFVAHGFPRNINILNAGNARYVGENEEMPNMERSSNLIENTTIRYTPEPNCPEGMETIPWRPLGIVLNCYCEYPFLPYPVNGSCYELFKQGPCPPRNFLVQPLYNKRKFPLPRCAPNPCIEDGLVLYNGVCHNITLQPICNNGPLYFKESTSEIRCRSLIKRQSSITPYVHNKCQPGYREDKNGVCRKKLYM